MPFAQVAAINIIYPLSATTAAVIFLRERVDVHHIFALIVGFIGAIVIVNPNIHDFNYYSLFAINAVMFWTISDLITAIITNKESGCNQLLLVLFFMGLFAILLLGSFFTITGNSFPEIKSHYWVLFCIIGVIAAFHRLCITLAVVKSELNIVAPFYFAIFPVASLVAYFVFSEMVKIRTVIGASMIIVSMIYISFREYKAK